MKLSAEELAAYLHRAEVGNPDAAKWASGKVREHIAELEQEIALELKRKENLHERLEIAVSRQGRAEDALNLIRDYAGHHTKCPAGVYSVGVPVFCNCGWDDVRKKIREILKPEGREP